MLLVALVQMGQGSAAFDGHVLSGMAKGTLFKAVFTLWIAETLIQILQLI